MLMTDKQGVEIDYCPQCRGIWLDRGELEKIIERSDSLENQSAPSFGVNNPTYNDHYYHYDSNKSKYGRKKGFLSELFD